MTVQEWYTKGWQHHQADQYPQAEAAFRQVLQADPGHAGAWALLAEACLLQGKFAEAERYYRQALSLQPNNAPAYANLGVALAEQGKHADAAASYRAALWLQPDYVDALSNLGAALTELDQLEEAVRCLQQALALAPTYIRAHNNLGKALLAQNKLAEAEASLRQAIHLHPGYAKAHANLGAVMLRQGRHDEAVTCLQQGIRLGAKASDALANLGVAFMKQGRHDEAITHLQQAIRLGGTNVTDALSNLGVTFLSQGSHAEAAAHLQQALRLQPDFADAHKNLAMVWLQQGNYEEGWPEYEWRWYCKEFPPLPYTQPRWDGSPLDGRTILLHTEQGLGDTIQFIRYAPLVQERGGRVIVSCQQPLASLLARCPGIDAVVARGDPLPPFDAYIPLLSLPAIFHTTLATIPAKVPYLLADGKLVESWGRELAAVPGFKVGIAWQGNRGYTGDRERSTRLAYFEPLARVPGVRLVSLQVGPGTEQLQEVGDRFPVLDVGGRFDPASFEDAAAVVATLDLVISVDSAIAHLAGGLGVPAWVLLAFAPDWRWLLRREDSPWYPSLRLFRQTEWGQWQPLFDRVALALRHRLAMSDAISGGRPT